MYKMSQLSLPCHAKINLFLHITGRRPDGYHELQTVFQLLDYGDTLHLTDRSDGQLRFLSKLPGVNDGNNLILRAARLLQGASEGCSPGCYKATAELTGLAGLCPGFGRAS